MLARAICCRAGAVARGGRVGPYLLKNSGGFARSNQLPSGGLWCTYRWQSAFAGNSPPGDAHSTPTEADVLKHTDWKSKDFRKRLGFSAESTVTKERIKVHYRILAKKYHPDTAGKDQPDAADAFRSINEAYEVLSKVEDDNYERDFYTEAGQGFGQYTYSDDARRRVQMRVLGEGVALFMVFTIFFIMVVSRHNKDRLYSRYLWHLLAIFFIIQAFPRLLAAAVLFAFHSSYLTELRLATEQANVTVIVERVSEGQRVTFDGIDKEAASDVVVEAVPVLAETQGALPSTPSRTSSSTFKFDKGVTAIVLPIPPKGVVGYDVTVEDKKRRMVLVNHKRIAV